MIPYIRAALKRLRDDGVADIWLFPGIELTAKNGRQCLLLFDQDVSDEWLQQSLGKLGIVFAGVDALSSKQDKVTQLTFEYPEIEHLLNDLVEIRGRFIVLPNVSQGGKHTVLVDKGHADFLRMGCVGGYLDRGQTRDTLQATNRKRLSGTDKTWTTRPVYPLPTSDCRSADRTALGSNNTWIKLAAPTAESIRQALLAESSRIRIGKPTLASLHITNVTVRKSAVLNETSFDFSPELNSIIGGRGSGKSTFLEYVAFGIGRACIDTDRETYSGNDRHVELINETLKQRNGSIQIIIEQDGARFVVERSLTQAFQPFVTYPNGSQQSVSVKELRALFPAVVYAQGELAELGKKAAKKTDLADLLQFVNPSYKREDDELLERIAEAKRSIRQNVEAIAEVWSVLSRIKKSESERNALRERVTALEKTLPALSQEDQAKVERFDQASAFEAKRVQASKQAQNIFTELKAIDTAVFKVTDFGTLNSSEEIDFHTRYTALESAFRAGVKKLEADLRAAHKGLEQSEAAWKPVFTKIRSGRDEVLKRLSAHKTVTTQIIALREELAKNEGTLGELSARYAGFKDAGEALGASVDALKAAVEQRAERTAAWAAEIQTLSQGKIIAKVLVEGDPSEVRDAIEVVSAKTGSQEGTRVRELETLIAERGIWSVLDQLRVDVLSMLQWRLSGPSDASAEVPAPPVLFQVLGGSAKVKASLASVMDVPRVSAISAACPKPMIDLTYTDGLRQIAFEKASEGQRAAALLFILLAQPGGPLIIDQPESDLDNSIIADLTQGLHTSKQSRQIIFASHNANIVVNGSSELVGHLNVVSDGVRKFETVGAIDVPKVRDVITGTMEGGRKAFQDRQYKYGF